MSHDVQKGWLDRPVDERDHTLGPSHASITLVEYGSYACGYCREANESIATVRDYFGDRVRYVFRQRPIPHHELARRAAELVERAEGEQFWKVHMALMTRSSELTEEDLVAVAAELDIDPDDSQTSATAERAKERVESDVASAKASGVLMTPSFFINNRRYDGPWDEQSLCDAMRGTLEHRLRSVTLDFVGWGPSAGVLLLLTTLLALVLTNSPLGAAFEALWHQDVGMVFGDLGFRMSLRHWINDGLLTIFFLVVGLEIKREITVGHLASRRSAALPIAAAIGGMVVPALLYLLIIPAGPWTYGWGVPMATDTAFAIALMAVLGRRVPVELRVFLTAAAIVDDIGSILVVAAVYSGPLQLGYLAVGAVIVGALGLLNQSRVYRVLPYMALGILLWACVHASGLHATLAGVLLALFIPTRPPPNFQALLTQANLIVSADEANGKDVLRHGPSLPALRALDAIHERLESPASRVLRLAGGRSTYLVLPLFALANAGVVISTDALSGHNGLLFAIMTGLVIGKPIGLILASRIAVWTNLAEKPDSYSWLQLAGAGGLAGIGFTMSLFIAGQAFPIDADFAAAKLAVLAASVLAAVIGVALLWGAAEQKER
ncbi:Na+/H+ antiporter NhaA [Nitrospira lenta]|uniref:Na(+)/H(+) antiporter NhaA n=1 Tax=Nitrospira lenta TaxID=1436998 RepID=A0A330L966_9BACT|nr:Na+/H+ antiporter NhaA [Nitrospira lenta]SPP65809.1 Na(+)/H(+) antiporter NhaA [Nitrospira lenta]